MAPAEEEREMIFTPKLIVMENAVILPASELMNVVQKMNDALDALTKPRAKEKEFVSNEEFMRIMSISKRTAQCWRDEGVIAFSQVGSKIYYSIADIDKLLQDTRHGKFGEQDKKKGGKS